MLRSSSSMAHEAKEFNARIGRPEFSAGGRSRRYISPFPLHPSSSSEEEQWLSLIMPSVLMGGIFNLVTLPRPRQERGTVGKMLDLVRVGGCEPECNVRLVW